MDMVASLPAMKLDKLYENPFICKAILRSLPPLAKKCVLQMLEEWVLPDGFTKHKVAVDRLIQLRVLTETVERKKETNYILNSTFQTNLQQHLIHGGVLPREPMPLNVIGKPPSPKELEAYALGQWECFLLYLISSGQTDKPANISSSMMRVFQRGLLTQRYYWLPRVEISVYSVFFVTEDPLLHPMPCCFCSLSTERDAPKLIESGFQFLLMDTNAQLWYIMREYISNSEERGDDLSDLIAFLLELSFHITGRVFCKKGCDADRDSWEECLSVCDEICYKDPVLKDKKWSAYIDRSPGPAVYSEECFHACVSGCGYKFEMDPEKVDKVHPNRPPPPPAPVKTRPSPPAPAAKGSEATDDLPCTSA